jgi:hypothetical protein
MDYIVTHCQSVKGYNGCAAWEAEDKEIFHKLISCPDKPWLPLPDGYRLVTDEEMSKLSGSNLIAGVKYLDSDNNWRFGDWIRKGSWLTSLGKFAVPIGFTFDKPAKEMTVSEVEKELGYAVKIVKEEK